MEDRLLEIAFKAFLDETIKSSKNVFSNAERELLHLFKIGLKKYLTRHRERFTSIKTILQGSTPVYLYDFYFPLKLIPIHNNYNHAHYRHSGLFQKEDQNAVSTDNIDNVFSNSNYITIMGDAGSGKSTLVKHLFITCVKEKFGIPFLLELRYLNEYQGSIEEYVGSKILEEGIADSDIIIQRMLASSKFIFFLDGYDELNSNIKEKIVRDLESFINRYPRNKFILTSRPYSNIEHFQTFSNFEIKSLNETEINQFIGKQLPKEVELANKIRASVKENQNEYIKSFLTNPLLLSLYILTYQSNSDIPPKKYIFYRRVIQALFSEHDSRTKIGYRRERKTDLTQEQFEEVLKRFSFLSFFEARYDFEYDYLVDSLRTIKDKLINIKLDTNAFLEDLKSALALWVEDNGVYAFAHRSMQEYYVATFIKRLDTIHKQKIYEKIIFKTGNGLTSETRNLLDLCEEMDPFYFYSYYKLPLLKELRNLLHRENKLEQMRNCVKHLVDYFIVDFNIDKQHFADMELNMAVYRYIYFHLPHMQALHAKLQGFPRYLSKTNNTRTKKFKLDLEGTEFPKFLEDYCFSQKLDDFAESMVGWLDKEIEDTQKFIDITTSSNDELVNMI